MLSDDDTIFNFSIWTAEAGGMWNLPLTPNSCGPVLADMGNSSWYTKVLSFVGINISMIFRRGN